MKRTLAPLNPLRAFEAAARLLSFTAAGDELSVTQVAISRQVRTLEDYLGVELFVRHARSIRLTKAGMQLLPAITRALDDMSAATSLVSRRGRPEVLAIQSFTTFSQCWLIRMLPDFHAKYPDIEVQLSASSTRVDFDRQDLDAAIYFGMPEASGLAFDFLAPIELQPVISPALLARQPDGVIDLARLSLLHSLARPSDWTAWLRSAGLKKIAGTKGHKFESSALAYEAAIQGLGVALGVKVLVAHYLAAGQLVAPFEHTHAMPGGYYLVRPPRRPVSSALSAFREWLLASLEKTVLSGA